MIPFIDLVAQHAALRDELDPAIASVLESADFVTGEHVERFEQAFAAYCGARFGIGVNSGTSALHLALLAAGVERGHEVIAPAFTFLATPAAIVFAGARPVLVDVDPRTLNIDVDQVERAITGNTRAVVAVHLYGQPAEMAALQSISERHGVALIEDAAQAHGASYHGRRVGSLGDAACFSFYPSKNLGAAGEAGMVVTNNPEWAERVGRLRSWGQASPYQYVERGFNHRMGGLQAAILGVKLRHLDGWNAARRRHAARYTASISGPGVRPVTVAPSVEHAYYVYVVRALDRARVQRELHRRAIETRVHYPSPVHLIDAWNGFGYRAGDFPHAERAAREVVSLPVYPELTDQSADVVASALEEITSLIPS